MKAGDTVNVYASGDTLAHGQATRDADPRWLVTTSRTFYDHATGGYMEKVQLTRRVVPAGVDLPDPDVY